MLLNKLLFDTLTAQAKANPRLRQHFDLRNSEHDQSQRMLNALEPGTVLPIHRHLHSSESVAMLRGKVNWIFYDDQGNMTGKYLIEAGGDNPGIVVPKGQWHTLECLESGTVVITMKDGVWEPLWEEEIFKL
ncbi:MAG: WbuC family cupin fold metalloprotein [Bacteroidia bacterium]|nr:WbuC family cupin fold metalloprotein [Bacteroidia bacterium]